MTQPILETPRLILRPFDARDASLVEQLAGAREIADTTLNIPHPYPAGAAEIWIAGHPGAWTAGTNAVYAITLKATGELVGAIALAIAAAHARAEIGYWIAAPHWNNGYSTEAGRRVTTFGFEVLGLHRIQGRHLVRNHASGRVMTKLGMRLEGVHRDAIRKWDRFEDIAHHAILVTDETDSEPAKHEVP
jgi:[ribosomal protein S5]-alanine N-acetyltransferase